MMLAFQATARMVMPTGTLHHTSWWYWQYVQRTLVANGSAKDIHGSHRLEGCIPEPDQAILGRECELSSDASWNRWHLLCQQ
jgi:hypothetical protein